MLVLKAFPKRLRGWLRNLVLRQKGFVHLKSNDYYELELARDVVEKVREELGMGAMLLGHEYTCPKYATGRRDADCRCHFPTKPILPPEPAEDRYCPVDCGGCACHVAPPCKHCVEHIQEET